ncbi:hypothetical protein QI633_18730 [Nocardioides sp. QY071]|uniref:hypothetical protein n=1 Tax=Nocardioides sp. QY071 TaxID=3044187 RepID=UPI00249BD5CB|nr:hypothetical protein [Nocardioides sp. QY071]WGY00571.1 hypothetical protein QI633_18730 [Nocardioides sp. QY071]
MTLPRLAVAVAGAGLALWAGAIAANQVLFHGFSPNCADGHPEYDATVCGVTWGPGLPYVAVALLGLVVLAVTLAPGVLPRTRRTA